MFTDTHCHIYKEYYDNIQDIINESKTNGVNRWISAGCNMKSNEEVIKLLDFSNMYGVIGIHPEDVLNYCDKDIKFIEKNINKAKILGIGEIGLDYYYTKESKKEQIELFNKQLAIAEKYNKPVVIHSREATLDTIDNLKKYKVKGVIHSFNGSLETAKIYIKMGFLLGVNGVITFKNCNIKDIIKEVGLENIILETDSPYLTPHPYRGKQNSPKHIIDIANFVADLYNVSLEELENITNNNIKRIFDI